MATFVILRHPVTILVTDLANLENFARYAGIFMPAYQANNYINTATLFILHYNNLFSPI